MYKIIKDLFSKPAKEEMLEDTLIINSVKEKIINAISQEDEETYNNIDMIKNEISVNIEEVIDDKLNCKLNEFKNTILNEVAAIIEQNISNQKDNQIIDIKKSEEVNVNPNAKIYNNVDSICKEEVTPKENQLDTSNKSIVIDKLLDVTTPKTINGIVQVLKPFNRAYFSIKRNEKGEAIVDFSIKNTDENFYKEYFNIDLDGTTNEYQIPKVILEKLLEAITEYNDKISSITIFSNHKTLYILDKHTDSKNILHVRDLIKNLKSKNVEIIVIKDSGEKEYL